jgi:Parvulin-like peptidyl-prolyl isomerase
MIQRLSLKPHNARRWLIKLLSCAWLLVAMGSLAACQSTENGALRSQPSKSTGDSPIAFQVGNQSVSVEEVQNRINQELSAGVQELLAQGQTREQINEIAQRQGVFNTIIESMIQEYLIDLEAQRLGIGIDPQAIDSQIGQTSLDLPEGISSTELVKQRVAAARQQKIYGVVLDKIRVDQFKSRHILVETEAEANDIMARLAAGEDFGTLAEELSLDPGSASNGGEYGWLPRGSFVSEYEDGVFDTANALNTPFIVKSQYGYHVIEALGREANRKFSSFEELSSMPNAQQMFNEQFLTWYEQYRQEAEQSGQLKILVPPDSFTVPFPEDTPQ